MRPEWTDAEKGEAAGIAHRAAFASHPDPLSAAHIAADQAMSDYPDWWRFQAPAWTMA